MIATGGISQQFSRSTMAIDEERAASVAAKTLTGRIVRKKKFQRHVSLAIRNDEHDQDAVSIPILIDRNHHKDSLPLCCLGAWIRVHVAVAVAEETDEGSTCTPQNDDQEGQQQQQQQQHRVASKVELVQCAPDPNAVLLCLTFVACNKLPLDVFSTTNLLEHLHQVTYLLEAPRELQRREIGQLVRALNGLKINDARVTSQRKPHTRQRHLRVLERLEQRIPLMHIYKDETDANVTHQSMGNKETVGPADDIVQQQLPINLPYGSQATIKNESNNKRIEYLQQKKWPQIQWIVQRLAALGSSGRSTTSTTPSRSSSSGSDSFRFRHVLDVGGGRGDLATAIATAFPDVHVTVVDRNESSLQAGKTYAQQLLGLQQNGNSKNRMSFYCADFAAFARDYPHDAAQVDNDNDTDTTSTTVSPPPIDAVVALHACGDLSDLALQFASQIQAAFVICPCCYTKRYIDQYEPSWIQRYKDKYYCQAVNDNGSNNVATTSDDDNDDDDDDNGNDNDKETVSSKKNKTNNSSSPDDEVATVQRLAELNERPEISHRAMHVINSLRLKALDTSTVYDGIGSARLEEYENTISMRNLVLVGEGK